MKREIYFPVLGLIAGELAIFFGQIYTGLLIHIINLQLLTLLIIFSRYQNDLKKIYQSFFLLLLMRIINLEMPHFFTTALLSNTLLYGVMFVPVYYIIKHQKISSKEIGMNFNRLHIYIPAAFFIGTAIALIEYHILKPFPLIENLKLPNIILITLVMFSFVAAVEEIIFRSILQTRIQKMLGLKNGLILTSISFGIMHSGYGLVSEILFATFFGMVLGYTFQKTESFPFILAIHGTANVLLFGILPIILV